MSEEFPRGLLWFVRIVRWVRGSEPGEVQLKRIRRFYWVVGSLTLAVAVAWAWVVVRFDLSFGAIFDLLLVVMAGAAFVKAIRSISPRPK